MILSPLVFPGEMDRGLFYWSNLSRETCLSKYEEEMQFLLILQILDSNKREIGPSLPYPHGEYFKPF